MNKYVISMLSLLLLTLFCTSCGTSKIVATSQVDSVRVEIRERIVEVPATAEVEIAEIAERVTVRQDTSRLANTYARSEAIITPNGELQHSLETIPQKIGAPMIARIPVRDTMIFRQSIGQQLVEVPREFTAWQKFRLDGFWVLLVLIIAILYCNLRNLIKL